MGKKLFAALLATGLSLAAVAQTPENDSFGEWYIGLGGGVNFSSMRFSNLDDEVYPDSKGNFSGVFSVFAEWDFGRQRQFAIRPQLSFLTRGGQLTGIGQDYYDYKLDEISDIVYGLKATYCDIRIPLIYQFCGQDAKFRPYAYVAPILGFATGGRIDGRITYLDNSYEGVGFDTSKANLASTWFAGAIGVGAKWQFLISDYRFFLALEASYQIGFTDTYSSREKDNEVTNVVSFYPYANGIEGTRKLSGFELQASLGIPFSIFSKKEPKAMPEPVFEEPAVIEPEPEPEVVVEEKPCYSLDEIITLIAKGQNVEGKTICAIDDINFDFAKSDIKPESYPYLDKLAAMLIRTNARVEVKGHTDNIGGEETNMILSRDRAMSVVKYLIDKGVSKSKLSYSYYGMTRPLTTNDTEEGRKLNRRVEFELK